MAIQNTFHLDVDIKQKNYINEPVVTSNDQVTFILQISDDGLPFDLSNVTTFTLVSVRPDHQSIMTLGTLLNDEVKFELGTNEIEIAGKVNAAIQMYDADGRVSSIPFTYSVLKDFAVAYVPSETEKTLIELVLGQGPAILADAKQAMLDANTAATNANQAVANVNTAISNANDATDNANKKAILADTAATNANEKAVLADTAATNANNAKDAAEQATTNAINATNAINLVLPNVINLEYVETYNSATQYEKNNIVRFGKNSYIALQDTQGNAPTGTTDSQFWGVIAIGGIDGTGTGTVNSVNGILPVNGDVTIAIPETSNLATKQELKSADEALEESIQKLSDALIIVDNSSAKKMNGYFPLNDANLITDLSSYAFKVGDLNTPPGNEEWATIANFPALDNSDRAFQIGQSWNSPPNNYYIRKKDGTNWTQWYRIVTEESRVWSNVVLQNGWSGNVSYRKSAIGQLELILDVKVGTSSVGTIVAQLPEGYRPSKVGYVNLLIPSNGSIINGALYINYEGKIMVASGSNLGSGNYFVASLITPLD